MHLTEVRSTLLEPLRLLDVDTGRPLSMPGELSTTLPLMYEDLATTPPPMPGAFPTTPPSMPTTLPTDAQGDFDDGDDDVTSLTGTPPAHDNQHPVPADAPVQAGHRAHVEPRLKSLGDICLAMNKLAAEVRSFTASFPGLVDYQQGEDGMSEDKPESLELEDVDVEMADA